MFTHSLEPKGPSLRVFIHVVRLRSFFPACILAAWSVPSQGNLPQNPTS